MSLPIDFSIEQENLEYISNISESTIVFSDKKSLLRLNYKNFIEIIDEDKFDRILENQNIIEMETLEEDALKFTISAESLFSANSNESLVLVEFSKNKLAMVISLNDGTFLIGRLITSLK